MASNASVRHHRWSMQAAWTNKANVLKQVHVNHFNFQHPGLVNVLRMILDPGDCWINNRIFATPTLHMLACNIAAMMAIDMLGFSMDINAFVETILHQTIELEQTQIVT